MVPKSRRNPVSARFSLSVENERADAGRDGQTCLARPNSQARTGTAKFHFPSSADHDQDWHPYPVDPYSAIYDGHTYIHVLYCTIWLIPGLWRFLSVKTV